MSGIMGIRKKKMLICCVISLFLFCFFAGCSGGGNSPSYQQPQLTVEQIKSSALKISYDSLFRNNEKYIGSIVYYRGGVLQIQELSSDEYEIRLATKKSDYFGYLEDIIYVNYKGSRLMEGDVIDVWGRVNGIKTYTAVLGNSVSIPEITTLHIELYKKKSEPTMTQAEAKPNFASPNSQTTSQVSQNPAEQFSSVTHASVFTMGKNWDADPENDGVAIYPSLLDANDKTVEFSDVSLPVDIEMWTTKFDNNYKQVKDKLVYRGTASISSSSDSNMFMGGGIRVPFEQINAPSDNTYGWMYVKIHTPDGKVYEAINQFTSFR